MLMTLILECITKLVLENGAPCKSYYSYRVGFRIKRTERLPMNQVSHSEFHIYESVFYSPNLR